jgi:DNA-binding response OmpR family regulator
MLRFLGSAFNLPHVIFRQRDYFKIGMKGKKPSILCVEENRGVSLLIATALGALDYKVVRAFTCAKGLKLIRSREFDLYIVNRRLPDGCGVELCKAISALNSRLPIILIQDFTETKECPAVKYAGISTILSYPFQLDTLEELVTRLLS